MIFKMSYRVFMLFTSIDPTQAPPFIPHLRGGSLLAGNDKNPSGVAPLEGFRFPWKAALFRTFIVSLSVENVNCELYSPPAHQAGRRRDGSPEVG